MGGYDASSDVIEWFWLWLSNCDQEMIGRLLSFVTGCCTIPVDGLDPPFTIVLSMDTPEEVAASSSSGSSSSSSDGKERESEDPQNSKQSSQQSIGVLPRAHTCFNQLVLPPFPTAAMLEEKMVLALEHGAKGFFMT